VRVTPPSSSFSSSSFPRFRTFIMCDMQAEYFITHPIHSFPFSSPYLITLHLHFICSHPYSSCTFKFYNYNPHPCFSVSHTPLRGYMYWRLLSSDPEAARAVVLSDKPEVPYLTPPCCSSPFLCPFPFSSLFELISLPRLSAVSLHLFF
jgi:hypothetical protein